jgi:hypothetical protein
MILSCHPVNPREGFDVNNYVSVLLWLLTGSASIGQGSAARTVRWACQPAGECSGRSERRKSLARRKGLSLFLALMGVLVGLGAFSMGSSSTAQAAPEDDVRATLQATVAAWNSGNVEAFLNQWTDEGLMAEFEATRAELRQFLPEFIGSQPITLRSVTDVLVTSFNASANVELAFGRVLEADKFFFVFSPEDMKWRISGTLSRVVPIPPGVTPVPVALQEFAFVYDKSLTTSGNIAFQAQNIGAAPHELQIAKLNTNRPLVDLINEGGEGPPEGVEDIGGLFFEPGEFGNVVFTQPLAPGRYAMVCFVETPQGVPHAALGMFSEFTVGPVAAGTPTPPGTGTIAPPRTGDAGLVGAESSVSLQQLMFLASVLLLVAGLGSLATAKRP